MSLSFRVYYRLLILQTFCSIIANCTPYEAIRFESFQSDRSPIPEAINDSREVVGFFSKYDAGKFILRGFKWSEASGYSELPTPTGCEHAFVPVDISNDGSVLAKCTPTRDADSSPVLLPSDGEPIFLGFPPGFVEAFPIKFGPHYEVLGMVFPKYDVFTPFHKRLYGSAFVWTKDKGFTIFTVQNKSVRPLTLTRDGRLLGKVYERSPAPELELISPQLAELTVNGGAKILLDASDLNPLNGNEEGEIVGERQVGEDLFAGFYFRPSDQLYQDLSFPGSFVTNSRLIFGLRDRHNLSTGITSPLERFIILKDGLQIQWVQDTNDFGDLLVEVKGSSAASYSFYQLLRRTAEPDVEIPPTPTPTPTPIPCTVLYVNPIGLCTYYIRRTESVEKRDERTCHESSVMKRRKRSPRKFKCGLNIEILEGNRSTQGIVDFESTIGDGWKLEKRISLIKRYEGRVNIKYPNRKKRFRLTLSDKKDNGPVVEIDLRARTN